MWINVSQWGRLWFYAFLFHLLQYINGTPMNCHPNKPWGSFLALAYAQDIDTFLVFVFQISIVSSWNFYINSTFVSYAIFLPFLDNRLTADWHTPIFSEISMVVKPSLRCPQKHNSALAWTADTILKHRPSEAMKGVLKL